jgi:hypothetical protein
MTRMTLALSVTADTPVRGTANPAPQGEANRPSFKKSFPRVAARLCAALTLAAGLQVLTPGPAAVATLPPSILSSAAVAGVSPSVGFIPQRDPALFQAILADAFPIRPADPVSTGTTRALDPDELMQFGSRRAPRWLVETILKAAEKTGVDPVYMMTLADVESSLLPAAKAPTSSAAGLFQFIDRTWLEVLYMHGAAHGFTAAAAAIRMVDDEPVVADESQRSWILNLKRDPYLSALMAGELIRDIARELQANGERELTEAELYLAHFFGASSAIRFLAALDETPDASATRLFPRAAKANLGLFSEKAGRKRRSVTVSELYDRIDSKIVRRLNFYDKVARGKERPRITLEAAATQDP